MEEKQKKMIFIWKCTKCEETISNLKTEGNTRICPYCHEINPIPKKIPRYNKILKKKQK